ncbi:hypothetical protein H5P28_16880 [Ruficoccus amylovorans]|uniref:Uncharacterized protein n=1 Tax=Ruficoccus amylovorans TaxID=1804625 RepID=A0A842HHQ7_9BACT|nr:SbcC/MukB-like Walker B domain-containing protein [Ruficoccus amylovorans]MBC2595942.1 hypothetical protein [Ruficoccus amylovorans]
MDEDQGILEFAPDRSTAGFRLHEFSLFNWGTFHGRIHTIKPDGRTALLTGANGSGKSTLADAILTLLIDSRSRNYNQASGQMDQKRRKKERSERDYILGAYSQMHDDDLGHTRTQYLRKPGETHTVLLAVFYNENFNTYVSLAQVLWINTSGRIDRAFLVERRALTVAGDFDNLGSPSELRGRLRERGLDPIETFTAYSQRFHEYLYMPRDKSPMDIFNQAICIKDIANLTRFIRDYMLDDGGAAEKLANLRKNFEELRLTYQRILTDKERLTILDSLHNQHEQITLLDKDVQRWNARKESLRLFLADQEHELRSREQERLETQHATIKADILSADLQAEKEKNRAEDLKDQLNQSDEGRRLRELEKKKEELEGRLKPLQTRAKNFQEKALTWREGTQVDSAGSFAALMQAIGHELPAVKDAHEKADGELRKIEADMGKKREAQATLNTEVRSLLDRRNNIPNDFIERRSRIASAIGVQPGQLPYAGELLQVHESEPEWTGALERLARSFALSILVPESLRWKVDDFVHREHQRGLVVYHVVNAQERGTPNPLLKENSAANKLDIHPDAGEFRAWLERELSYRFPHECFESPGDAFHRADSALTLNGLIRQKGGERRKDDRSPIGDRSHDVLGWDNQAKLRALEENLRALQQAERELEVSRNRQKESCAKLRNRIDAANRLPDIAPRWEDIDWESVSVEIEQARQEIDILRKGSAAIQQLRDQLKEAQRLEQAARTRSSELNRQLGGIETQQGANNKSLNQCQVLIGAAEAARTDEFDPRAYHRELARMLAFPITSLASLDEARIDLEKEIDQNRQTAISQRNKLTSSIKHEMEQFLSRLQTEDARLHDELASGDLALPGYNASLYTPFQRLRQRILEDDLPKTEDRFRRLLHTNAIDEVHNFDNLLTTHADAIEKRIEKLNGHLRQIDFDRRKGTYIQLVPTRSHDDAQKRFRNLRRYALANSTEPQDNDESRLETYKHIEEFLRELEKDETWTQRVIDVRNWFEFRADEFNRETEVREQTYDGASGKSGGEKNRLASTILATAIAYQYGISVNERQSDTFRLVVVDEMFSKTDDEFSEYLLELFREFHLQLIIIQPLDSKIHLVQKYVERYHIVTRSGEVSTVRNLTVQEYSEAMATIQAS